MQTTDERVNAVCRRVKELEQRNKAFGKRIISLSSIAAGLFIIVTLGLAMPNMMMKIDTAEQMKLIGIAGIFSDGAAAGYILIALVAFVLGVCVTLLCISLNKKNGEAATRSSKGDNSNG
ncbi:MAG: DUF4179 domain-containing protein [Hydrogenoanaerobacterium sp.]